MCVACRKAIFGVVLAFLCHLSVAEEGFVVCKLIQEEQGKVEFSWDEKSLSKLDRMALWERTSSSKDIVDGIPEKTLGERLEWLGDRELGRGGMELVSFLLLKAWSLEDASALDAFARQENEDHREMAYFSLGWNAVDENLERALESIALFRDEETRKNFVNGMAYSLYRYERNKLIENFETLASSYWAKKAIRQYVVDLAKAEPRRGYELYKRYGVLGNKYQFLHELLESIAKTDSDVAFEFAMTMECKEDRLTLLRNIARELGQDGGKGGIETIERFLSLDDRTPLQSRRFFYGEFVNGWSKREPIQCLQWIAGLEDPVLRKSLFSRADTWNMKTPDKEMLGTMLTDGTFGGDAVLLRENFFDRWSAYDTGGFIQWSLKNGDDSWVQRVEGYRLDQFAGLNPELVLELAETLPEGKGRRKAVEAVAKNWSETDTSGFLEWVGDLGDDRSMESAMYRFFEKREVSGDLEGELELANGLPEGAGRDVYLSNIAESFADGNIEASLSAAKGIENEDTKLDLFRELGKRVAFSDPDSALALMARDPELAQTRFGPSVLFEVAGNHPEKAYEALHLLENSGYESQVAGRMFVSFYSQDEGYAEALLESEPSAAIRDGGWSAISRELSTEYPLESLDYASRIEDPGMRLESMRRGYAVLKKHYPERAEAWRVEANFDEQDLEAPKSSSQPPPPDFQEFSGRISVPSFLGEGIVW